MPDVGLDVTFAVIDSRAYSIGMYVWVEQAGEMKVLAHPSDTSLQLQNTGWAGNAVVTTVIPTLVKITPTGKSAGVP